jgi:hypothetical protein
MNMLFRMWIVLEIKRGGGYSGGSFMTMCILETFECKSIVKMLKIVIAGKKFVF